MSLLVYAKVTVPPPLAAGNPAITPPPAPSAGARGKAFNVTGELRPNLAVDPQNGVAGGVSLAGFAALQVQVAAGQFEYQWSTGVPEYKTGTLIVGAAADDVADLAQNIYIGNWSAQGGVPGLPDDNNDGLSPNFPIATIARYEALKSPINKSLLYLRLALGTYAGPDRVYASGGSDGAVANPEGWVGTPLDSGLGTLSAAAGSSTSNIIASAPIITRISAVASITAAAGAGQARIMTVTGLSGLVASDVGRHFLFGLWVNPGNNGYFECLSVISPTSGTFRNAQSVVEATAIGYWQDSFFFAQVKFTQSSKITAVAVASLVNNDFFTVTNPNTSVPTVFEYKVSGAYVPVAGRVTVDVSALGDPSATGVVVATAAQINTTLGSLYLATPAAAVISLVTVLTDPSALNPNLAETVANAGFLVAANASNDYRTVVDMGRASTGAINAVAVASLVDNDNFFVPDGTGPGVTFEFKVTGGFVPVGGRVTIDVSLLVTAAEVANAIRVAINAVAPTTLRVRATNTIGNAQVQVENMLPGASGNVAITEAVANAGFTVTGFTLGVGAPTTTITVGSGHSVAFAANQFQFTPAVGDTFVIQTPGSIITCPVSIVFRGQQSLLYLKHIKFVLTTPVSGNNILSFEAMRVCLRCCDFQLNGSQVQWTTFTVPNTIPGVRQIDPAFPWPQGGGIAAGNYAAYGGTAQILNKAYHLGVTFFNHVNFNFVTGSSNNNFIGRRTTVSLAECSDYESSNFFLDGALLSTDNGVTAIKAGLLSLPTGSIKNCGGYAIRAQERSIWQIGGVVGVGNAKGLSVDTNSHGQLDSGGTTTVTGNASDFEFGHETVPNVRSYAEVRTLDATGTRGFQDTHLNRVDAP